MPLEMTHKRLRAYELKRSRVLAAAARVFGEVGYDGASMRRIAAEAQVSPSGIYHDITSKEELLHSIQLHTFDSLLRSLQSALAGITDPRERLAAVVRNHVRHFGENRSAFKVCARELETLAGPADGEVRDRRRAYFEAVHAVVKDLRPCSDDPRRSWLATANLFGMLNWFFPWYDAERARVGFDELAAQQTALFLDGYVGSVSDGDEEGDA